MSLAAHENDAILATMLCFRTSVVRLALGSVAIVSMALAACTSFGSDEVPSPDAAVPSATATVLVEASAPDASLVDSSAPDAADSSDARRACTGNPLASFTSPSEAPTLVNLTVAGNPSFAPTPPFVGYPMVAVVNPSLRATLGLKGMANASLSPTGRFCFEMWAHVSVPTAGAGGEVVVLQIGLGGPDSIRIDFGATSRFGGMQLKSFLAPTDGTAPHHWVVEVFPFADRHKATLTIDGVSTIDVTSPSWFGAGATFLAFGVSTDSAMPSLVKGGRAVIGEAYATFQP